MNKSSKSHAFVTGVSRGIGLAIALKLLQEGFYVTGTHHATDVPVELTDHESFDAIQVDLGNIRSVNTKLKPILSSEHPPDILINNAGIALALDLLSDDQEWLKTADTTMMVNFTIPALLTKWILPSWIYRKSGILINIASRAAYRGDTGDFSSYAASKAALTAFTKSVAREYSRHRITAVTIAPGFIETDMAKDAIGKYGREHVMKDLAVPELAQPEDVAEVVCAVAMGKMLQITGSTIHVNGGSYLI